MAPTTKDAENSAESSSLTTPVPGAPKAADGSNRTQPVALEIPVTVNGARTVEGSDKREPFSEATKTVLIFNQGAVIRIATPVAAGQLVFLTNEKSKKEVVCQVVKSKPGGGPGAGYIELQFTEPAVGFWGLRFPAAPGAPAAPSATVPATPRAATPAVTATTIPATAQVSPVAPSSPASNASRPVAPAASVPAPAPKSAPPVPPVAPKPPAPTLSAPPPPKAAAAPPAPPVLKTEAPQSLASPTPPSPAPAPSEEKRGRGIPEIHDYSKEIAAIFAVPPVGSSQSPTTSPVAPQPSSEELKEQAARLQVQLSSMLFTESAAAPPAPPTLTPSASSAKSPATGNAGSVAADSAQKVAEAKPHEAKPAAKPLPKPVSTVPKAKSYDIEQVEEVKVPDWLAPLSRNTESPVPTPPPTAAPVSSEQSRIPGWLSPLSHIAPPAPTPSTAPADVATISASPAEQAESHSVPATEAEANSHDEPFGGKMLDDSLESSPEASTAGSSKKGLFLGLAAATLLLAGGGVWYMRQTHGVNSRSAAVKAVETPAPSPTVAVNSLPTTKPESAAVPADSNSPAATVSPVSGQPAKNSTANLTSPAPATVPKNTAPLMRNEAPAEQPKKPSLGEVHLSAPVVNRAVHAQQNGEADPSLTTGVPTPGAESLSSFSASTKEPSAPLPVGGDVKSARLIKSVPPVYPPVARTQRIAGSVSIDAVVDTEGNVSTMKVLSGPAILHRAALDAVKQWHYEPALLDGKPTASHLTVIVQFRLQ